MNKKPGLWLFNISKQDISLSDLRITIRAGKHLNLLTPNLRLTEEQISLSIKSGSIAKRPGKLRVSRIEPAFPPPEPLPVSQDLRIAKPRSIIPIEEAVFPELELTENPNLDDDDE